MYRKFLLALIVPCVGVSTLSCDALQDQVPSSGVEVTDDSQLEIHNHMHSGLTTQAASQFELLWKDDFNFFDGARWQLMTHTWDGNLAQFSTTNTRFQNGILSLLLTREPSDAVKPFRGVEMRSRDTLTYGKIETRARY